MNLLNRYLVSQFIKYFFTVNAGFVSIYLLVDFFEKIDNFKSAGKSMSLAINYFIFTIPYIVDLLGPVLILLAGVITLGILNHTNELTALKAGGVPLKLIIRPLILSAVFFTLLFIAAAQWLLPQTVAHTNNIWYEQLKGKVPLGIVRNNRYHYKGQDAFYSFGWPNPKKYIFKDFSYSEWDENYNLKILITASWADWDPEKERWVLKKGQVQQKSEDGTYEILNFKMRFHVFNESPEDFLVPINKNTEQSLSDLYFETENAEAEYEQRNAWTNFLGRISYLFLGIPLLLLGLPILLYSYRKWGRDLSVAIPVSCGLAFLAWGIWGALQSLSIAGYISPLFAAVTLHILFSLLGLFLLIKNDR
ncbi:LptF/LptG family permease [Desulforhopalus singaporensis]|uniref:Lipopolysaccharide export system permease protein n=1 Tax=Desulforhopalus singaporensis TaxID=91360 RepID=A0A1H0RDH5_9BACT|nr:LptF/LptG family permease [Desulforhopalus singaporensis]SDP27672.1 lipopolysaccharide export system permease protein [Desulforhopalus singaporensis]